MKRLLRKADGMVTYVATSPIVITHQGDQGEVDRHNAQALGYSDFNTMKKAIEVDMQEMGPKGLAEHLEGPLAEIVTSIIVGATTSGAETKITCIRELTQDELDQLEDYITGQYSDGWGEGFEQFAIGEYDDEIEEELQDDEGGWYTDTYNDKVAMYAHFWNDKDFTIQITRAS